MKNLHLTIINLVIGLILLVSPFLIQVTASPGVYDPWCDQDSDGDIDIFDIVTAAVAFDTTGDPTKTVYVQNWPVTNQITVFFGATSDIYWSEHYNASGFGHMHVIWRVTGLSGDESVTLGLWVRIRSSTGSTGFPVQSTVVNTVNEQGALSFPVPSEEFFFSLDLATGTTATVYFAFYLTYA